MHTRGNIIQLPTGQTSHPASFESAVREHLEHLMQSSQFDASRRSQSFLRFIVEETLAGHSEQLSQAAIAAAVFGRKGIFDPLLDPIVRVQAGRLRRSLERYYLLMGTTETLRIELPKGRYVPVFVQGAALGTDEDVAGRHITHGKKVVADWPMVLIHPLEASSDDSELASRITDTLMMELYGYRNVRLVYKQDMDRIDSRLQASVRFEFRGSLRCVADDSVIGARLVDRTTGTLLWSHEYCTKRRLERWSSSTDDIARVIAARIGAESGVIIRTLTGEYAAQRTEATGAFSAILPCHYFLCSHQVQDLLPALQSLQDLTARQPGIAVAWACLSRLYLINYSFDLYDLATPIEKAIGYASQGVHLDPASAGNRCALAVALLVKGELQSARDEIEQALRLNSESLAYREVIGWLLALAGDWERGMALLRDAMERNPYCLPHVKQGLWADHLQRGEFELAYVAALEYHDSSKFWREGMIACCLGHLGRRSDARISVTELLRAKPDFPQRGRTLIGYYIKSVELYGRIVEGLEKAGLPLSQSS